MIKNIIFDINGVLRQKHLPTLVEDVLPAKLKKQCAGRFKNLTVDDYVSQCAVYGNINAFDVGAISYEEYLRNILINTDEKNDIVRTNESELEILKAVFNYRLKKSANKQIEATYKLANTLFKEGFNLYVLSNVSPFLLDMFKSFVDDKIFKGKMFSCEVKLAKPDPEIYAKALKKWKIKANESLFIDDNAANLVPFTRAGGYTFLFDKLNPQDCCQKIYEYINKINSVK